MASRFGSNLHQRDTRADLFKNFSPDEYSRRNTASASPSRGHGYGVGNARANGNGNGNAYAYPGASAQVPHLGGADAKGYRPATPNSRGQYSDAVLSELESQNDDEVAGILGKVRILKDMSMAIGDEIRDSSALAEKMNDSFDRTRVRLRGTMNRMLVMAERTGVPWKVWLAFFAAVVLLFVYVWLF